MIYVFILILLLEFYFLGAGAARASAYIVGFFSGITPVMQVCAVLAFIDLANAFIKELNSCEK